MSYNIQDTYVYFEALDYTGTSTLSTYTLDITPLTFIPDFTTSNVLSGTISISNKNLRWNFGDGTFSTDLRPTHTYKWPGRYTVTLTIFDSDGNAYDSTYSGIIQVYDYISTQINFQEYKGLIYDVPAGRLLDPLYVNVYDSWQNYSALSGTGYTINLYASGAAGDYNYTPLDVTDKWDHLRCLSRFYRENKTPTGETEYLEIESLTATHTEMYVKIQGSQIVQCNASDAGSVFAGITGTGKFWYTDEKPNALLTENNPIIIFATLDNSKFKDAYTQRMQTFKYVNYPIAGFQNI
jgi:PKD repeat protein